LKADRVSSSFTGRSLPQTRAGPERAAGLIDVPISALWTVETGSIGFLPDGRADIPFERHKSRRRTVGRFDAFHAGMGAPADGYGEAGAHQHVRLAKTIGCDQIAAIDSASWCLGQIMGYNVADAGYTSTEDMVAQMAGSKDERLVATVRLLLTNRLVEPLRRNDWARFARGYNGVNGAAHTVNRSDDKVAAAYDSSNRRHMLDLSVGAIQLVLTYAGEQPGTIDGLRGPRRDATVARFAARHTLSEVVSDELAAQMLDQLNGSTVGSTAPLGAPPDLHLLQVMLAALGVDPEPIDAPRRTGHTRRPARSDRRSPVPSEKTANRLGSSPVATLKQNSKPTRTNVMPPHGFQAVPGAARSGRNCRGEIANTFAAADVSSPLP